MTTKKHRLYTYYVIDIADNGKHYAYTQRLHQSYNLMSLLKTKNLVSINACDSKKTAELIANCWNNSYKENGTYLY